MANFKGVMLCERPQEPGERVVMRPYCGRVTANEQLGLCPTEIRERKERKCKLEDYYYRYNACFG